MTERRTCKSRRPEDIVFVLNPSLWYQSMYPTGILCLSSYLELHGYPNSLVDGRPHPGRIPLGERETSILERIKERSPRIVCFSSTHLEFDEVVRLNSAIRAIDPSILTIVGGSQPTYRMRDFLDNGFDFVCVGEGEKTLLAFVEEAFGGTCRWHAIEGLAWRDGDRVMTNPPRALMTEAELDYDLIPGYEKLDPRFFAFDVGIIRGLPMVGALVLTTRGCPFNCSFCGCNSIFGRRIRHRPTGSIEREIRYLTKEKGVEGIWILDDTFTVNPAHASRVAGILHSHHLIWGCQSRVDSVTQTFMEEMKRLGCVQMDFGVESGSQRILDDIIGKKTNLEQVKTAFSLAKRNRIRTLANFMIGLPTETMEDLAATKRLADQIKADICVFSIATPLPGTRLYGMVGEDINPQEYAQLNWNGSLLTGKLNKSGIKDVVGERRRLKMRYLMKSILKSAFSLDGFALIIFRRHRVRRIRAAVDFIMRTVSSSC